MKFYTKLFIKLLLLSLLGYIMRCNLNNINLYFNEIKTYDNHIIIGLGNIMGFFYILLILLTIQINIEHRYRRCHDHFHLTNLPKPLMINAINFTTGLALPVLFFYFVKLINNYEVPQIIYFNCLHGMFYGLVLTYIIYI